MPAIDTIWTSALNPSSTRTATTPATGDSLQVRNFNSATDVAYLEHVFRRGATAGTAYVLSPRLHDPNSGINWNSAEAVDTLTLPNQAYSPLYPADNLTVQVTGGAAETDAVALLLYYSNIPGLQGQFISPGDLQGQIKNVKAFFTASPAGANAWTDTAITTTDNQLHADADYAVLGYKCSAQAGMVAIKAPETGNLRVGGPASTLGVDTADWFVRMSRDSGYASIPVFNANNRGAVYVSAVDVAAVAGLNVTLICAELVNRVTSTA